MDKFTFARGDVIEIDGEESNIADIVEGGYMVTPHGSWGMKATFMPQCAIDDCLTGAKAVRFAKRKSVYIPLNRSVEEVFKDIKKASKNILFPKVKTTSAIKRVDNVNQPCIEIFGWEALSKDDIDKAVAKNKYLKEYLKVKKLPKPKVVAKKPKVVTKPKAAAKPKAITKTKAVAVKAKPTAKAKAVTKKVVKKLSRK